MVSLVLFSEISKTDLQLSFIFFLYLIKDKTIVSHKRQESNIENLKKNGGLGFGTMIYMYLDS